MHLSINWKRWKLVFVPISTLPGNTLGLCSAPHLPRKEITIANNLTGEEKARVLIHEMLHAGDWNKAESWVERASCDISHAMKRLDMLS